MADSLSAEARSRAATIADLAARGLRQSDLDSVRRDRRIQAPKFQRSLNVLIPFRRVEQDISRLTTFHLAPSGLWIVAKDSAPMDTDFNLDGRIDPQEQGRPPGRAGIELPPEALSSLKNRRPESVIVDLEQGRTTYGFAPLVETGSDAPASIVAVEIPTTRLDQALSQLRLRSLIGAIALGGLILGTLLAICHSRRALEMVRRLEQHRVHQEAALKNQNLNLG